MKVTHSQILKAGFAYVNAELSDKPGIVTEIAIPMLNGKEHEIQCLHFWYSIKVCITCRLSIYLYICAMVDGKGYDLVSKSLNSIKAYVLLCYAINTSLKHEISQFFGF